MKIAIYANLKQITYVKFGKIKVTLAIVLGDIPNGMFWGGWRLSQEE